jgi:hypothetical protein
LRFFGDKSFFNYWIDGGTSNMLATYIKNNNFTVEQFRNLQVSRNFVMSPGEMDVAKPEAFLYQGGFLTLREGLIDEYSLDYPNKEVLDTMSRLTSDNMLRSRGEDGNSLQTNILIALASKNIELLVDTLNRLLAAVPYDDFSNARKQDDKIMQSIYVNGYSFSVQEWLYRSTIFAFLRGCGVVVQAEMHTNKGRADLVIQHRGNTYIIEIKVAHKGENTTEKAEKAYMQIFEKNYNAPFPNAVCVGIAIDDEQRKIMSIKHV